MKIQPKALNLIILLLIFALSGTAQTAAPSTPSNMEVREKIARDITENLAANKFEAARKDFAKIMLDALSENKLKQDWQGMVKKIGAFQKVLTTNEEEKNGYKVIKKRCQFASENATIQVSFNEENQVIGLYFKL